MSYFITIADYTFSYEKICILFDYLIAIYYYISIILQYFLYNLYYSNNVLYLSISTILLQDHS